MKVKSCYKKNKFSLDEETNSSAKEKNYSILRLMYVEQKIFYWVKALKLV